MAIEQGREGGREEWGGPEPGWSTGPKHVPRKENEEEKRGREYVLLNFPTSQGQ